MKRFFVFLGIVFLTIGSAVRAQEAYSTVPLQKSSWGDAKTTQAGDYIPEVSLKMRGGYNQDFAENAGRFYGDGLYLDINGKISPSFSYSLNQRLASSYYEDNTGFNGTNWLTLTYETGDFAFTAGKDGILVGSFEYDTDDLDSYYDMNSSFYNGFDCWQWGVYAAYYPSDSHEIYLQAANSPYSYGEPSLFAYAAAWRGYWDHYESYWSANLWEYERGNYVKSLNLGNRFYFGNFTVDLEYMARATQIRSMFGEDFTALVRPSYEWDWGCAFAKFGIENMTDEESPASISSYMFYGAGLEFFPLKENKNIRLHAAWAASNIGYNALNIGLTWFIDFTGAARRLFTGSDKLN